MFPWFAEICHHGALVPLLFWAVRGRDPVTGLVAFAYAVSWVPDTITSLFGDPWQAGYIYPMLQIGLLVLLLIPGVRTKRGALVVLGVGLLLSWRLTQGQIPEVPVRLAGGVLISVLAWRGLQCGALRASLLTYFGVGTLCYVAMAVTLAFPWWVAYQVCRLAAFALLLLAIWRPNPDPRKAVAWTSSSINSPT